MKEKNRIVELKGLRFSVLKIPIATQYEGSSLMRRKLLLVFAEALQRLGQYNKNNLNCHHILEYSGYVHKISNCNFRI